MLRIALIALTLVSADAAAERQLDDISPYSHYRQAKQFADQGQWQQAVERYRQAQQLVNARIDLSLYQLRGIGGFDSDPQAATERLTKEAENGSARAMLILSSLFQHGHFGCPIDISKAQKYRLAYQQISQQKQLEFALKADATNRDNEQRNKSNI
ncbi:hypothetical protein IC617_16445 [Neiella sp. HB171785]|uniref:Sel1 repeat family protein n=1 Tax=Neiella litorisoli TaxID=2771431 RepID=A0A8J6UMN4_9GAMM|nr:hypothetical protein [Neiella litorisoli]MBD1391020.1 hypothetical protein [Neiella litorisoli]